MKNIDRESAIERYFVQQVKKYGGRAEKWGIGGNPDRIVFWNFGRISFVELKTATGALQPTQKIQFPIIAYLTGFPVVIIRSKSEVDDWLLSQFPGR